MAPPTVTWAARWLETEADYTTDLAIRFTDADKLIMNGKPTPTYGGMVPGLWATSFAALYLGPFLTR
jgi:hypothetical protein